MPWTDGYSFGDEFVDLRDHPEQARPFEHELHRELSAGHTLYGRSWKVVARALPQDEVVIQAGEEVALVHLTWTRRPESPPWPEAVLVGSEAEFESVIEFRY
jgi:hypothetical protein